jgi:pre-mRNA cleavage complex 2 protein Pcf11
MEAYALVDTNVRRKMDEMLKTWKEPVPGALDTRPVFPRDVTGPIENALIKARTSAVQAHNEYLRSQQQNRSRSAVTNVPPHRDTPTPPTTYRQPPPTMQNHQNPHPSSHNNYRQQSQTPVPTPPTSYRPPPAVVSTPPVNYGLPAQPPISYGGPSQPPAPSHYGMPIPPPSNNHNPNPVPSLPPSMLMELLRASGKLPQMPVQPLLPASVPTPPLNPTPAFPVLGNVPPSYVNPPPVVSTPRFLGSTPVRRVPLGDLPNDVVFSNPHSLKLYDPFSDPHPKLANCYSPRPHLISRLYEKLGTACTQCGRRFQSDEAGRKKKADHMDWHFKVHSRMREAERNGQHRSLYVDEIVSDYYFSAMGLS